MLSLLLLAQSPPPGGDWQATHTWYGSQSDELFGATVAWVSDVNGDAFDDLIVNSPSYDTGVAGTAGGAVFLYSGMTGIELDRIIGDFIPTPWSFGRSICALGDVTGDGVPEVAIGKSSGQSGAIPTIQVYSVLPWTLLYEASAPHDESSLGAGTCAGGSDLNGDGWPDLVAADSSFRENGVWVGAVHAFNGLDGSLLWRTIGQIPNKSFGQMVICPGDVNGDGYAEVVTRSQEYPGIVHVLSGVDGSEMYRILGDYLDGYIGTDRLAPCGDVDRDGLPDFLVGQVEDPGVSKGLATIHRGYDGAIIHRWEGRIDGEGFANRVSGPGDLDDDGVHDFAVGAFSGVGLGKVYLFSGRDFELMQVIESPAAVSSTFGFTLSSLGSDVSGDGGADIAIGDRSEVVSGLHGAGAVYLFTFDRYLRADAQGISAVAGGALHFTIDFPDTEAGRGYRLLASDDLPGSCTVGGVGIPLVITPLLKKMVTAPPPVFDVPLGTLDINGDALVTGTLPPNALAAYVGRTIKFAAVSLLAPNQPGLSSAAAWVKVTP